MHNLSFFLILLNTFLHSFFIFKDLFVYFAMALGIFDLYHFGIQNLLTAACEFLVVACGI